MRTTKRIAKLLEGATLRDKIKLLSENSYFKMSSGKDLYTPNELKSIVDNITECGEGDEYNRLVTAIDVVANRRGELYFEQARLSYFSEFAPHLYNTLQDYSNRLAVNNSLVAGFTGIGKDSYGSKEEEELARYIDNLVDMYCSKMTDEDQDVDKKIYPYRVVRCKDGKLRLHAPTIKRYLEFVGKPYLFAMESAKTTYLGYMEYVERHDIKDLMPKDVEIVIALLVNDYVSALRVKKPLSYWSELVDEIPVPGLDPGEEYGITDIFGVGGYYPLFDDVKAREEELGKNNRFEFTLSQYEH